MRILQASIEITGD